MSEPHASNVSFLLFFSVLYLPFVSLNMLSIERLMGGIIDWLIYNRDELPW